ERPQIEPLVTEQDGHKEYERDRLAAQELRPVSRWRVHLSAPIAHTHEGAARAEQISRRQQGDDEQSAVVDPNEQRREVGGGDVLAEQSVQNDNDRGRQQDE